MGQKVILKNVTVAYPDVWKATQVNGKGEFKYRCTFLIEPGSENDKILKAAIKAAAVEAWKDEAIVTLRRVSADKSTFCYRDGDTQKHERYHGLWSLSTTRRVDAGAPGLCGPGGGKDRLAEDSGKPYSGCVANASVDIWAQKGEYEGIRCTLLGMQFVADGQAFSSSPATTDDFEPLGEGSGDLDEFGDISGTDGF